MRARAQNIRLIKLAMAVALVFPAGLFAVTAFSTYRSIHALADERLTRSLDVQQEEVGNAFELVRLVLNTATETVADMSAEDIRRNEQVLHGRLKKQAELVEVVQSIWIYGLDGRALVNSWTLPSPTADFSDRDFIKAHVAADAGIHVGQIYTSSLGAQPFFTISRKLVHNETPVGIVEISIPAQQLLPVLLRAGLCAGTAICVDTGRRHVSRPLPRRAERVGSAWTQHGFRPHGRQQSAGRRLLLDLADRWRRPPLHHPQASGLAGLFDGRRGKRQPPPRVAGDDRHASDFRLACHAGALPDAVDHPAEDRAALRRDRRPYGCGGSPAAIAEARSCRSSHRGIAHDFNNLLTIIIGNLEAALRQPDDAGKLKRRIDSAMHGAHRAAALTKRLLAFSRQQPLMPKPVDVNRLINSLSDFLHRSLGEHIALEVVGGAGVWPIEVDPAEMESALVNLAVNARDAMPSGGKLTIEASNSWLDEAYCEAHAEIRPGQYVVISVTDTGEGMSKEVVGRAFEPFFTTKQSGHGTGLGLSQVYGFVKQSGGHVKIYSEVGEGTTINIYLPRYHGETDKPDAAPARAEHDGGAEHILLVEDDADVRAYVAETLSGLGYRVSTARSGPDALRLLETLPDKPQLLLTDVVMPGMNGRQLADKARALYPALKVVYMTGYSRNAIVHQGRLDPGVDLLQKPLSSEALAKMVRAVLDR